MTKIYLTLILILCFFTIKAQHTNKVWAMGFHTGVDFNTSPPTAIPTASNAIEGCASISDGNGQLLLYASGDTLYNRNHQCMPNGYGILRAPFPIIGTCTQSSLIVPMPGATTRYYVFAMEGYELTSSSRGGRLLYSIVDMSLDNGLGDVIAGQKAIVLDTALQEKMTAAAGCTGNIWIIVRPKYGDVFKTFELTETGISPRVVISPMGSAAGPDDYMAGVIKLSPDGTRMVSANRNYGNAEGEGVQLFDFSKVTGKLSNRIALAGATDVTEPYGACFSPGGSKLYIAEEAGKVWQYDLSLPAITDIISSKIRVNYSEGRTLGDIQTGPDGKMYVANFARGIDRITNPDAAGAGCGYVEQAIDLNGTGGHITYGLPNVVIDALMASNLTPVVDLPDTVLCHQDPKQIKVSAAVSHAAQNAGFQWGPPGAVLSANRETAIVNTALSSSFYLTVTNSGVDGLCNLGPATDTMHVSTASCLCALYLPNAFSPNGDGLNDWFSVQAPDPGCFDKMRYTFSIFNRWGERVYQETKLGKGWDGRYKGQPAAADTYHYYLKYEVLNGTGQEETRKGNTVLIR